MYNYIYDNYSNEQIMYFTLFILFIADLPIIFFTFLDIYKFNFLNKYRINYNCYRKYPNKLEIIDGAKHSLYNLFAIIIPITTIGIFIANYINYFPYKMNRELPHYTTILFHFMFIFIVSDILFYGLHRLMHTPILYKRFHKIHHKYNEPFSLTNHYIHPVELLLFFIPPVLPGIILNTHITIMWVSAILLNWNGILIHSGYYFSKNKYLDYIMPTTKEHDLHHKLFNFNFSSTFTFMDKLFGTYKKLCINDYEGLFHKNI